MNREIKFRVWDKKDNLMSRPFGLGYRNIVTEDEYYICDDSDLSAEEIEVMEYTGLKDKNGVEIYEGDIVERNMDFWSDSRDIGGRQYIKKQLIYQIQWGKWCYVKLDKGGKLPHSAFDIIEAREYEIIGNIFENPELLEENND